MTATKCSIMNNVRSKKSEFVMQIFNPEGVVPEWLVDFIRIQPHSGLNTELYQSVALKLLIYLKISQLCLKFCQFE